VNVGRPIADPGAPLSEAQFEQDEEDQLRIERMETRLIRALYKHPGLISHRREHQLRYGIRLAGLRVFEPGAARRGGSSGRGDVEVESPLLSQWRSWVLDELRDSLIGKDTRDRIEAAAKTITPRLQQLQEVRREVAQKHEADFSRRELDEEIGIKTLVSVAGGGGGSGYVYFGAWDLLQNAGLVPGYIIGTSIGAVLGLFRAAHRNADIDEGIAIAKSLRRGDIFRFVSVNARYGLPGITRLFLHAGVGHAFEKRGGGEMRLSDLEIPFETVVGGLRRGAIPESPEQYARSHHLPEDKRPGTLQLRAQIASQLVRIVGFINPRAVSEIVIGGDELTRDFNAIDAAGFSAAIPGILHYDVTRDDPHMNAILTQLLKREDVVALVDGGTANNVPARVAWKQVQAGKIGTRNSYVLAFDCFHPQLSLGHIWMRPVTQLIAYQVALNERFAQQRIEFQPTLSPVNLLPGPDELDQAVEWGRDTMAAALPRIQKFFERVRWAPEKKSR
jgi:predicted acylesterase/phospholipase RssA